MLEYLLGLLALLILALLFIFGSKVFHREFYTGLSSLSLILAMALIIGSYCVGYFFTGGKQALTEYQQTHTNRELIKNYLNASENNSDDAGVFESLKQLDVYDLFNGVKRYLQLNPLDSKAWVILGNLLQGTPNPQHSIQSYRKAHLVNPNDAEMALNYVDARLSLSSKDDRQLDTESVFILQEVLGKSPNHEQALMLLGMVAFKGESFDLVIDAWQHLLTILKAKDNPPAPEGVLSSLLKSIDKARYLQQMQAVETNTQTKNIVFSVNNSSDTDALTSDFQLSVIVLFSDTVIQETDQLSQRDTLRLFVYAKLPNQPGMPLAAIKLQLPDDLSEPMNVVLTQQHSLMGKKLSSYAELELSARLSISGQVTASSGDWQTDNLLISTKESDAQHRLFVDKAIP